MSFWLHDSEISRLNAAEADVDIPLSPRTLDVLHAARKASMATSGAFDVTCRPLLDLWKQAGKRGQKPSEAELAEARSSVGWRHIELTPQGAVKHQREARLDLGGIAKGYAVDRAVEALQHAGLVGGIVDVGGDLRCFGDSTDGSEWAGEIRNPFGEGSLARLRFRDRGVCSSGNYARFTEIEGHRYSHIVDPRSGWPADAVPSVTVIAATALEADIWATALSVLGEAGLDLLPGGVDALLVVGTRQSHRMLVTVGFRRWLSGPLTEGVTYHEAKPSEPRSGDGHTP
jgi:thiamine biosynthesis lipoprotein